MFGMPSLKEYIGIPFSFGLLALAIARKFPSPEATIFLCAVEFNVAVVPFVFLIRQFIDLAQDDEPRHVERPTQASYELPVIKQDGKPLYTQSAVSVRIDCVSRFNRDLLIQKASKLPVNMTEGYWIKKVNGAELSNWQKAGGVGKGDWEDMILRGIAWGAYAEIGGQKKRVPADWSKIRMLSNGYTLPQ